MQSTDPVLAFHRVRYQLQSRVNVMKKVFAVVLLTVAVITYATAATQTLTGTVTDTMCGRKHMMPGKTDAQCIAECVKAGSKYALLVGDKLYLLQGDQKQLQQAAGKKVTVEGALNGNTISISSFRAAK